MTGRWSGSLLTCMTTSTGAWRPLVRVSDIQAPREMPARTYGWTFSTRTCPNATRLPKPMLSIATEHSVIRSMWSYTTASIRLSSFRYEEQTIIPAESVYAVFEAKQTLNKEHIEYAREKVASVRRLHRTSLPIPHAGGTYPPKPLIPICGGLLTLESDWKPAMGESLHTALGDGMGIDHLDLGCVAAHGYFRFDEVSGAYKTHAGGKPATAFLLTLISQLQFSGTVPMIDVQAYAQWLSD